MTIIWVIGAIVTLILTTLVLITDIKEGKSTHCLCCGDKLHRVGGYYVPYLGRGFCGHCVVEIQNLKGG